MSPERKVAAVLAAAALAVPMIATFEGRPEKGYLDVGGVPTACYGHTGPGLVVGKVYTDEECVDWLAEDAVRHGIQIDRCISVYTPIETRAAFTSFAYNVGVGNFCKSTAARKLNQGDIAGACAELDKWVYAKGKKLNGLVRRRAAERELCEKGITSALIKDAFAQPDSQWFDGLPPERFKASTAFPVETKDDIHAFCAASWGNPSNVTFYACRINDVVYLPNPCLPEFMGERYAVLACHEQAHVNGWSAQHED